MGLPRPCSVVRADLACRADHIDRLVDAAGARGCSGGAHRCHLRHLLRATPCWLLAGTIAESAIPRHARGRPRCQGAVAVESGRRRDRGLAQALRRGDVNSAQGSLRRQIEFRHASVCAQAVRLPVAVVRDHRGTWVRQDHGPGQFRTGVSARVLTRSRFRQGDWRYTRLRLVVHRSGRAARHGRSLHHSREQQRGRPEGVARFSRADQEVQAPTADQRCFGDGVGCGSAGKWRRGAPAICPARAQSVGRTA